MKGKKTVFTVVFLVICILSGNLTAKAASGSEMQFSGTRTFEYSTEGSDLTNFVNGGRPTFDLLLRQSAPDWLNYRLYTSERDVILSISFSFESYDDYVGKLEALLLCSPNILYRDDPELLLMEGHCTLDLLRFLEKQLMRQDCLRERTLPELLRIRSNEITLNGSAYPIEDRVEIGVADDDIVPLDYLEIQTTGCEDGSFIRKIIVRVDTSIGSDRDVRKITRQLKAVGNPQTEELSEHLTEVSVEFATIGENDLANKTMLCLNTATWIASTCHYIDDTTMGVEKREVINYSRLMRDGAVYQYTHSFPSYVREITAENEQIGVYDNSISASNLSEILCHYESSPAFSSIDVLTDFSKPFGKITRYITFVVPDELAPHLHENLTSQFEDMLMKGVVLDIYDGSNGRYYVFSFSSFDLDEVVKFSKSVLGGKRNLSQSDSWLPLGRSQMNEQVELDASIPGMAPPQSSVFTYKMPSLMLSINEPVPDETASVSDNQVSFRVRDGYQISFEYRCINTPKLVAELAIAVAVIIVAIIVSVKIKSRKKKKLIG